MTEQKAGIEIREESRRVVIVGASDNPARYAHKAMRALRKHSHEAVLVNPRVREIEGLPVLADLAEVSGPVHTVTMYVGPAVSAAMGDALTALQPERVIFNPGAENPELRERLEGAGTRVEEACTLVLLATGQF